MVLNKHKNYNLNILSTDRIQTVILVAVALAVKNAFGDADIVDPV